MGVDRTQRSTSRYKKARRTFMRRNPLCAECKRQGITVAANELDHIKPVHVHPELFWDRTNWQPLCRPCHEAKTLSENRKHHDKDWLARLKEVYGSD